MNENQNNNPFWQTNGRKYPRRDYYDGLFRSDIKSEIELWKHDEIDELTHRSMYRRYVSASFCF